MTSKEKIIRFSLWAVVVAGTFLRIISCYLTNPLDGMVSDPARHWSNALQFWHPDLMGGYDPIGYQVFMLGLQTITGGNRLGVALVCGLLSAIMPWTYFRAGRELGMSKNSSLLLFGLLALTPSLFLIYHHFMMETLVLPLIGLSLWMTARFMRKGNLPCFLIAAACWTLTCLTKTVPLPLAAICMGYAWWLRSRRVSYLLAALCVGLILIIPNAIRSRQILGFSAPFGNTWLPMIHHRAGTKFIRIELNGGGYWQYSSPSAYIEPLAPFSHWKIERAYNNDTVIVPVNPKNGARDWRRVYDQIHVSWRDWMVRWGENMVLFFFAITWPSANPGTWERVACDGMRWLWAPLVVVLLVDNCRRFRARNFDLIPVATTLFTLWLLSQNMAIMEGRFRLSAEPLLIMNLCWAISRQKK